MRSVIRIRRREPSNGRLRPAAVLLAAASISAPLLSTSPAGAESSDGITGTVVIDAPAAVEACLNIPVSTAVFGAVAGVPFSPATAADHSGDSHASTAPQDLESCSLGTQTYVGMVSDASGTTAAWFVYDPTKTPGGSTANICDHGTNLFQLASFINDGTAETRTYLTGVDTSLRITTPPGQRQTVSHRITMPCEGSSGSDGEQMKLTITYTAVLLP